MSFGSGSSSSSLGGVRGGGNQQAILGIALFAVVAVAMLGFLLRKSPSSDTPAPNSAAARLQRIQSQAIRVTPIALAITPQVTRDWIALDGVQDSAGIDNLVVGIVKTAYRKHLGDTDYVKCFGKPGGWTYPALKEVVGPDMMRSVRTEITRINDQARRDLRDEES